MTLSPIKRSDPRMLIAMSQHYSNPRGFVGRNICYAVMFKGECYGTIAGGSSTRFLPGRHEFLGTSPQMLNNIVNNIFFHIERKNGKYPCRCFAEKAIALYRKTVERDWFEKYGDSVIGHETLVELPRTGECYRREGWTLVGQTKGFTCKRVAGKGTDSWTGKRVWDVVNLRPKLVFCKKSQNSH